MLDSLVSSQGACVVLGPTSVLGRSRIHPSEVRFSQRSIAATFRDGRSIETLSQGLASGDVLASTFEPIRPLAKNGASLTLNNRRLWASQQANVRVPYRMATPAEVAQEAWKFTTTNGGLSIQVRR